MVAGKRRLTGIVDRKWTELLIEKVLDMICERSQPYYFEWMDSNTRVNMTGGRWIHSTKQAIHTIYWNDLCEWRQVSNWAWMKVSLSRTSVIKGYLARGLPMLCEDATSLYSALDCLKLGRKVVVLAIERFFLSISFEGPRVYTGFLSRSYTFS